MGSQGKERIEDRKDMSQTVTFIRYTEAEVKEEIRVILPEWSRWKGLKSVGSIIVIENKWFCPLSYP